MERTHIQKINIFQSTINSSANPAFSLIICFIYVRIYARFRITYSKCNLFAEIPALVFYIRLHTHTRSRAMWPPPSLSLSLIVVSSHARNSSQILLSSPSLSLFCLQLKRNKVNHEDDTSCNTVLGILGFFFFRDALMT